MLRRLCWLALLLTLGCATVESRIKANQEAFDSWPPEVQAKIRAEQIAVGFTEEQVRMAWGRPDRKTEVTAEDAMAHVWTWRRTTPGVGIGIGTGSYGRGVGIGTGISTGTGSRSEDEKRVEFMNGRVTRFEVIVED